MSAPAMLTIDLDALAANYRTLEAVGGVPVHPVVKADAYGLGAEACARRLANEGARAAIVRRPCRRRRTNGPGRLECAETAPRPP